ncbi:MAG TPA: class I tRNA ligase family protein, partial [Chlamydiales bacterium]|nr:class I tRNA ligase family protein [Chlamydiales bacterium]
TSSVTHARQIDLDLRRFEEFKNFANKIWNGSRFVFLNLEGLTEEDLTNGIDPAELTLEDRWILSVLGRTTTELNKTLAAYMFDRAATRAYEFFWNDFCAVYVELAKPVLFGKTGSPKAKANKQKLLVILLSNAVRLMHPIAPFITEEIFSLLKAQFPSAADTSCVYMQETIMALRSPACIKAPYPTVLQESDIDPKTEATFERMNEFVRVIRNLRAEMQIPPQEKTDLIIAGEKGEEWNMLHKHQGMLLALTPTGSITFSHEPQETFGASYLVGSLKFIIPLSEQLRARERARIEKELEKAQKLLDSTRAKLNNEEFRAKAPREVVEKLENAERQTNAQIAEMLQKIRD